MNLEAIEESPLSLGDKIDIVLVGIGVKPCSYVYINCNNLNSENKRIIIESVKGFNIPFISEETTTFRRKTSAKHLPKTLTMLLLYFGQTTQLVDELQKAKRKKNNYDVGILLGYLETAVKYFVNFGHNRLQIIDDYEIPAESRLISFFRFSNNYIEELVTVKKWNDALKEISPTLYWRFVTEYCSASI